MLLCIGLWSESDISRSFLPTFSMSMSSCGDIYTCYTFIHSNPCVCLYIYTRRRERERWQDVKAWKEMCMGKEPLGLEYMYVIFEKKKIRVLGLCTFELYESITRDVQTLTSIFIHCVYIFIRYKDIFQDHILVVARLCLVDLLH